MKIRVETNAYVTEYQREVFVDAMRAGDPERLANSLEYFTGDMSSIWTHVGKAVVTVEIDQENDIRANMAKTLEAERDKVLAEAQAKAMELNAKIQSLLAIEYVAPAPSAPSPVDDGITF